MFKPTPFETQKINFSARGAKQFFYIKSEPKFWNFKTRPNLYFLETRYFDDRFCLLRRFHPGPARPWFSHFKFQLYWAPHFPLSHLSLHLPHSPTYFHFSKLPLSCCNLGNQGRTHFFLHLFHLACQPILAWSENLISSPSSSPPKLSITTIFLRIPAG